MTGRGTPRTGRSNRGLALLVMLIVLALGVSWFAVTRLAASTNFTAALRTHNAEVMALARTALIGYTALRAARSGENNPGRIPCPEAPGNAGGPNEGVAAGNCALPAVGRLPWRTLGVDKLVDSSGEPLWYVVSPGWALVPPGTAPLTINSNTRGQLTVDGQVNAAVALIIAPGPAFAVQAAAGCAARVQSRSALLPDFRDYLECDNATSPADASFVTGGPAGSYNDQVLKVTPADLLPAIEAAIAHRIEREIVPQLKGVYANAAWGLSSVNPMFPYAAPFSDPATSNYQGAAGTFAGFLPFTFSQGCNPATDPRCSTTFVEWNTTAAYAPTVTMTGVSVPAYSCPTVNSTTIRCTGLYVAAATTVQLRLSATANHVAMALRQFDPSRVAVNYRQVPLSWLSAQATVSGQFNAGDGTATIIAEASIPGTLLLSYEFDITADLGVLADHPLLDASTASSTGWFVRNQWYRLVHYALAPNHAASGAAPRSCSTSPLTCLSVANVTPADKQRSILILAGRALPGQTRPSGNLADFLEFGNATSPAAFERQPVSIAIAPALRKPFNDRIIVVDANP